MGTWSLKQEDHKLETCLGCVGKHLLETKLEEKGLSLSACPQDLAKACCVLSPDLVSTWLPHCPETAGAQLSLSLPWKSLR